MACKNKELDSSYEIPLECRTVGELVFDFFLFLVADKVILAMHNLLLIEAL